MALPTGPIPRVAYDEIIAEEWGDSVAQSLNNTGEQFQWTTWSPGPSEQFLAENAGVMAEWFTFGGATVDPYRFLVPTWAKQALVTVTMSGITYEPSGATRTSYLLETEFGGQTEKQIRHSGQSGWFGLVWTDRFLDIEDVPGDRVLKVNAQRLEGGAGPPATRWKLDSTSDVAVSIIYLGAVDWYPGL